MILKALLSTVSRCEVGELAQRGEPYSIKLWRRVLSVDRSSGVPRKDFV